MKRSMLATLFGIALVVLVAARDSKAQSNSSANAGGARQDQVLADLLGEVRQLRIALQQISVNAYRGQILVERLRLQQEQVNRLSQELNSTRNQIGEMKSSQVTAKAKLDEAEKMRVDAVKVLNDCRAVERDMALLMHISVPALRARTTRNRAK